MIVAESPQASMVSAGQALKKSAAIVSEELELSLRLLTRMAVSQPAAALQIAQVEIPGADSMQLPGLVARAIDVLSHLNEVPAAAIGALPMHTLCACHAA